MKIKNISIIGIALAVGIFSACGAVTTVSNNSAANLANKSNTATVVNTNETVVKNTNTANTVTKPAENSNKSTSSTTTKPETDAESDTISGELQMGKTESVILYVGEESGDYAAYCFDNDSEVGKAITAACKNGEQCKVVGKLDGEFACKVPGLEADLSDSGKILKATSVKSLGKNNR